MTNVKLLLDMKREGRELSQEDIRALVASYTAGDVPDYQMASFAMAVCCRGMTKAEIDKKFDKIVEFAEMEKFIEMCFDPGSPVNERLKSTLVQMLSETKE